jgi:hypothetical protein
MADRVVELEKALRQARDILRAIAKNQQAGTIEESAWIGVVDIEAALNETADET